MARRILKSLREIDLASTALDPGDGQTLEPAIDDRQGSEDQIATAEEAIVKIPDCLGKMTEVSREVGSSLRTGAEKIRGAESYAKRIVGYRSLAADLQPLLLTLESRVSEYATLVISSDPGIRNVIGMPAATDAVLDAVSKFAKATLTMADGWNEMISNSQELAGRSRDMRPTVALITQIGNEFSALREIAQRWLDLTGDRD